MHFKRSFNWFNFKSITNSSFKSLNGFDLNLAAFVESVKEVILDLYKRGQLSITVHDISLGTWAIGGFNNSGLDQGISFDDVISFYKGNYNFNVKASDNLQFIYSLGYINNL